MIKLLPINWFILSFEILQVGPSILSTKYEANLFFSGSSCDGCNTVTFFCSQIEWMPIFFIRVLIEYFL